MKELVDQIKAEYEVFAKSQVSMAVPNFLSSDSGLQILHSALRFRSFTPPGGCVYGDKEAASSMATRNVILSSLSLSF